jgi:hypothetical protein
MTREADRERRTARRLADDTRRDKQRLDREQPRTDVTGGTTAPHGAEVAPAPTPQKLTP